MRKLALVIMMLMPSVALPASQVIRYVDPDATGAANGTSWTDAYTSLHTAQNTEKKNLVTADEYYTFYCRSSGGTHDTTPVNMAYGDWTTDATHYIEYIGADFPSDGVWDDTKYVLDVSNNYALLADRIGWVHFHNLQIKVTTTGAGNSGWGIRMFGAFSAVTWWIDSCLIQGSSPTAGAANCGVHVESTSCTVYVYNTICFGFLRPDDSDFAGFRNVNGTVYFYNCSAYGCYYGFRNDSTTVATNCASGNNTDDFYTSAGTLTIDYCCTDDGDGTNGQSPSGGSWANEFYDAANGDFRQILGGNCLDNGVDDPGSGLYSDDIIGASRTSTWSIGAFEVGIAGPSSAETPRARVMRLEEN